jgi:hypothetical protein
MDPCGGEMCILEQAYYLFYVLTSSSNTSTRAIFKDILSEERSKERASNYSPHIYSFSFYAFI